MEISKAYKEIFEVLDKYKDIINININNLRNKSEIHLFKLKLDSYGIYVPLNTIHNTTHIRIDYNRVIGLWDGEKRKVSWPDDGNQPENEYLFCISFPTGPYFFDEDYPKSLFSKFFNELKTYNPKYCDSHNSSLYYSIENAGKVYNNYRNICNKYYELNKEDRKKRKIDKLKEEINKLEQEDNNG